MNTDVETVMSRLMLKFALSITLGLTLISLIAGTWGGIQPPNPILRALTQNCDGQPQPCWYGIIPGMTTTSEVKEDLLMAIPSAQSQMYSSMPRNP